MLLRLWEYSNMCLFDHCHVQCNLLCNKPKDDDEIIIIIIIIITRTIFIVLSS